MKFIPVFSVIILPLLLSCSSAKNTADKKNGAPSYNKLFIIANTADIQARVRLEKELAAAAALKGYQSVRSIDVIPPLLSDPKPPSQEELVNKVNATGCDALCIIYYLKSGEEIRHTPGVNFKGTEPMLSGLVAMLLSNKDKHVNNYDDKYTKSISEPGYYTKEKGFYILSELFDAVSVETIYSEKSAFFDDADFHSFSAGYLAGFVKHLEMKKLLKK
jgi:hypothetical protein